MPSLRTRSPRWRESPGSFVVRRAWVLLFDFAFAFALRLCGACEAVVPPRPAPPDWLPEPLVEVPVELELPVDVELPVELEPLLDFEPAATAGAALPSQATRAVAASTANARSLCVAREDLGDDKHNPFSFWCLRG